MPTLEFIQKSARNVDPTAWQKEDWFYPYKHFVNFIAPDYFGNPATYNYWGVWNYGEFASYIGIPALIFAFSIIFRYLLDNYQKLPHKKSDALDIVKENTGVGFFLIALFINLILITKNPLTVAFYTYNIPFLASTQPSRGIAIVDFALVILASVGCNEVFKSLSKNGKHTQSVSTFKHMLLSATLVLGALCFLWITTLTKSTLISSTLEKLPDLDIFQISRSNLILPTLLIILTIIILSISIFHTSKHKSQNSISKVIILFYALLILTVFDQGRFFFKFQSFSPKNLLYPDTPIFNELKNNHTSRYMTDDNRIMAPNLNIPYKMHTAEGYDPLYFNRYGQLVGMWERNSSDLTPFPANRIITPHNTDSIIADISSINYLMSFKDLPKYQKIDEFGLTKLYQKDTALPRVSVLAAMRGFKSDQDLANYMFSKQFDPRTEGLVLIKDKLTFDVPDNGYYLFMGARNAKAQITEYSPNKVVIKANLLDMPGLVYLADTYDEGWKATVDNIPTTVSKVNFNFRGVNTPVGDHTITMTYMPNSFIYGLYFSLLGIILTIFTIFFQKAIKNK